MKYKAIIFDLDNTIYPVASIGDRLFCGLFQLIEQDGHYTANIEDIKKAIQRKPFQQVATAFAFSQRLAEDSLKLLSVLEYRDAIQPFDDYSHTKSIDCLKFLVTTGFEKLQQSKIKRLHLEEDFTACYIVDPAVSSLTKKDIFTKIREQYNLVAGEMLVIGDDVHSEIQAGKELGMDTIVYDYNNTHGQLTGHIVIKNYGQLVDVIKQT